MFGPAGRCQADLWATNGFGFGVCVQGQAEVKMKTGLERVR